MNTCYRTWRGRAFCVLELFCSFLSRYKTHPNLLVDSATTPPKWLSHMDTIRLSVGNANFTCCDRNHINLFGQAISCDRKVARDVIQSMCTSKSNHLFNQVSSIFLSTLPAYDPISPHLFSDDYADLLEVDI